MPKPVVKKSRSARKPVRKSRKGPRKALFGMGDNVDICGICREEMTGDELRNFQLKTLHPYSEYGGHTFHTKCIDDWFTAQRNSNAPQYTCPICKKQLGPTASILRRAPENPRVQEEVRRLLRPMLPNEEVIIQRRPSSPPRYAVIQNRRRPPSFPLEYRQRVAAPPPPRSPSSSSSGSRGGICSRSRGCLMMIRAKSKRVYKRKNKGYNCKK